MPEQEQLRLVLPNHRVNGPVAVRVNWTSCRVTRGDLSQRWGKLATDEPVVGVTAVGGGARSRLNREIEIGERLNHIHGADERSYPPGLTRLVGYTTEPPYLAVIVRAGEPLADVAGQLDDPQRNQIARSLLRSLDDLGRARVVHRALSPATVLWDRTSGVAQISDFTVASVDGERRADGPDGDQWSAPEVLERSGVADPVDDLYSAALVIFWLFSGEQPEVGRTRMEERLKLQDAQVSARLSGVFAADPRRRPDLTTLTSRWAAPADRPRLTNSARGAQEAEALREFDLLRARQRADLTPLLEPTGLELTPAGTTLTRAGLVAVLALGLVVVALVLAVVLG